MENILICARKGGQEKKDLWPSLCKDRESSGEDASIFSESQPKKLVKRAKSSRAVIVNIIQSQVSKVFLKDIFFRRVHGVDSRIPKHVVSADEKYLRRYLELIQVSTLKTSQGNIPVNFRSTNVGISSESLNAVNLINGDGCGSAQFVFEYPVADGTGNVVISANAAPQWTIGTVMGSKSMINILNSPLFQQFAVSDSKNNLSWMEATDGQGLIRRDFVDSLGSFSSSSLSKLEKGTPMMQSPNYSSASLHMRFTSSSSTTTSYDLQSSASPTLSQGMLQCTWKEGIPHFVFSADDQKEVYVAKLRKVDPTGNKALDHAYLFYFHKGRQKGHEIPENNSQLVGQMNVSSSFTLCPSNNRIVETEFVLFGNKEYFDKKMYISSHTHKKSKGLSRKVSKVFRTSPSSKHKSLSKFDGSGAVMESCPWEPYARSGADLLETNFPSNYELAAIVAKDHLPCKRQDTVGGWGLKFLNKSGFKQTSLQSESCDRNTGDCSTSISILIPAGLHGGPKTINGGPSSLTDRWRSGSCDCGGWDMGCPLTVLHSRSRKGEALSQVDMQDDCQSFDFITQGSKDFSPTLRMVNVRDGLYFVHYQPPLSTLQSFSIAVAIIHRQNPAFQPDSSRRL